MAHAPPPPFPPLTMAPPPPPMALPFPQALPLPLHVLPPMSVPPPPATPSLNYNAGNAAQTVVLTHLPQFLRAIRILRDAAFPCGSARTVHLGSCGPTSEEERRRMKERGLLPSSVNVKEERALLEAMHWQGAKGGLAVVKMNHYIGAKNFAGGLLSLIRSQDKLPAKTCTNDVEGPPQGEGLVGTTETPHLNGNTMEDQQVSTVKESDYSKEEEEQHKETIRLMKDMKVYHLYNYNIPDPIPPDMKIPMEDPAPQDPMIPYNLLEVLTTLRLRFEESITSPSKTSTSSTANSWGGHSAAATGMTENQSNAVLQLDSTKLAKAAGGTYDEEADPLNAPEVVNAVMEFKRSLEDRDVKSRKRRVDIITEKMEAKVSELIEEGRQERLKKKKILLEQQNIDQTQPSGQQLESERAGNNHIGVQNQDSKPVIPSSVEDSGRRGVSNLPAWMTRNGEEHIESTTSNGVEPAVESTSQDDDSGKKRKFVLSEANRDLNVRKPRIDVEGGLSLSALRAANEAADRVLSASTSHFVAYTSKEDIFAVNTIFPPLSRSPSTTPETIKMYVTEKIVEYLGEEESTLIEFILKELSKEEGCKTTFLLTEMKMVLDEDAEKFVLDLYRRMLE